MREVGERLKILRNGLRLTQPKMAELIGMSDRIAIMCNGRLTGELQGSEATQEQIMYFATKFD